MASSLVRQRSFQLLTKDFEVGFLTHLRVHLDGLRSYLLEVGCNKTGRVGVGEFCVLFGIDWCVFGSVNGTLRCWEKPDIDSAAKKLLKPDEDEGFKGWNFHLRGNRIYLARGIYHKDVDGNCCPSRGGIVAELLPKDGRLELTKIQRVSAPEYQRWLWMP
jgi:hypothetical protein